MNKIFSIDNYSVIEDDDNYYYFRCLEDIDIEAIEKGKVSISGKSFDKLVTYREKYNETHLSPSRFTETSTISLDEMWSHIKKNFFQGTNCVSFSTNCNVSIDYDSGNSKYLMIKVPKTGVDNIYLAGQYMVSELDKYIENVITTLSPLDECIPLISRIREINSNSELRKYISEIIKNYNYSDSDNILKRFDDKQFFNEEQQLEYNKIIAKLSVLELFEKIDNILPRTNMNSSLLSTISMAYSSGEVIVYNGIIPSDNMVVSKTIIDLFSLLQQAEDKDRNNEKIKELKRLVLKYALEGYDLISENGVLYFGNDKDRVKIGISDYSLLLPENDVDFKKQVSLREVYDLTHGQIPYNKAKTALDFTVNAAKSKIKTYELFNILRIISKEIDADSIIDRMEKETYAIDSRIINRRNNSGTRICESVNIDMNETRRQVFNRSEQDKMLSYINRLSSDNLRLLISSDGLRIEKNLCETILDSSSVVGINEYYATTIIDQIDFYKIFKEERDLTEEERNILISRLSSIDCYRLYTSFEKLGISRDIINSIIFNLLVEDGFKDYNLLELSNAPDIDEIVAKNISNFNTKITPLRVDRALGVVDNINMVENSYISLRDYQQDALDSIEAIFNDKRFAGVILPTGAGKSFVAMAEMLKYQKKNIIYYAPNTGILAQVKKHILRNIIGLEVITDEEKKERIKNGEIINKNIVTLSEADDIIKTVFPHLKFYCYQGLLHKDEEFLRSHDADLIIFDELHRTGADEWNHRVKALINNNPNAKILGITATPVRDDASHKDMMFEFALLSGDYSEEELIRKQYLASELYLTDAMQEGIVVIPNLITFDYTLDSTDEFKELKVMKEKAKTVEAREKIESNYLEMLEIIKNSEKKGMSTLVKEAIENNGKRKNGKYIIFLPMNSTDKTTIEYIKEQMGLVREYFSLIDPDPEMSFLYSDRGDNKDNDKIIEEFEKESDHLKLIFALNMLNEGVHIEGLDGIMMLRPIGVNSKILYSQQIGRVIHALSPEIDVESNDAPLIFDVYNNYLSHNMDREVNKTTITSDLQKMRYIASWIKKHGNYFPDINSTEATEYRKAITLKRIKAKYSRYLDDPINSNITRSEAYEIEEILKIGKTLNLWDREIGDRIIDDAETTEARVNTFKVTGEQKRFLDLYREAKQVKSAPKINVGTIRLKNALSTLELLSEYGFEINNSTIKKGTILSDVLALLPKDVVKLIEGELQVSLDYELYEEYNYAKTMLYARHKIFAEQSIKTLRLCGLFQPFVDAKEREKSSIDERGFILHGHSNIVGYNIFTGTKYDNAGYDSSGVDESLFAEFSIYNKYGFNRKGKHIYTRSFYNECGFDVRGNYFVRDENGYYINMGKYDENGFDMDHMWHKKIVDSITGEVSYDPNGTEYDENGFNYLGLNEFFFNRDGFYCEIKTTQKRSGIDYSIEIKEVEPTSLTISPRGFNKDGLYIDGSKYDENGFDAKGLYLDNTPYNEYGFNCNKKYKDTLREYDNKDFDFYGIHRITRELYDEHHFDRDGFLYKLVDGKYVKSDDKIDEYGFDCDGYFWKRDSKGYLVKTDKVVNERGFYISRLHNRTSRPFDENHFDIDGYLWIIGDNNHYCRSDRRINDYHFDCDGYYYKKNENGDLVKTDQKIDERGFDIRRINAYTNEYWDENGLDVDGLYKTILTSKSFGIDGYYWKKQANGLYKKTTSLYNDTGKDKNNKTKPFVPFPNADWDEYGRDSRGSFYTIRNNNQFDKAGFYWEFKATKVYSKTDKRTNPRGFLSSGKHSVTLELWDEKGFDINNRLDTIRRAKYFDSNGFYWKKQAYGYAKTDKKLDPNGFDGSGLHYITRELWDESGRDIRRTFSTISNNKCFDSKGFYWERQSDGTYKRTDKKVDPNGFNKDCINVETNEYWDKDGRDIKGRFDIIRQFNFVGRDGHYWDQKGGRYYKTSITWEDHITTPIKTKWDSTGKDKKGSYKTIEKARCFDDDGYYWEKQEDGSYKKTNKVVNERLFNKDGIHQITKTRYDEFGFDIDGINEFTNTKYDKHGFDYTHRTKDLSEYNEYGFRYDGIHENNTRYDDNGFDIDGIHKDTGLPYNTDFIDRDGKKYLNLVENKGYTKKDGYYLDRNNFDNAGFYYKEVDGKIVPTGLKVNERGFTKSGIFEETNSLLDHNGFDMAGVFYPSNRYVKKGKSLPYDLKFFDCDGHYYKEENGVRVKTNNMFNEHGFGRDGMLWVKQEDGTYIKTDLKYNDEGIDFYGFNKDGIFVETGLPYDRNHFNVNGVHTITKEKRDETGFDRDGRRPNGDYVDGSGFYQNGINYETNTRYDKHNLDIFHIEKSKREDNFAVNMARDFLTGKKTKSEITALVAKGITDKLEQHNKFTLIIYKGVRICPELKDIVINRIKKLSIMLCSARLQLEKLEKEAAAEKIKEIKTIKGNISYYKNFV